MTDADAAGSCAAAPDGRPGYITDYISGEEVRASPEETEAVQVFARRLVEDYGYDKSQIQVHPQFRVRKRPSDEDKSYPVDIAVFKLANRTEANLFLVVECKQKNRLDGVAQLKLYMEMSPTLVAHGSMAKSMRTSSKYAITTAMLSGRTFQIFLATDSA